MRVPKKKYCNLQKRPFFSFLPIFPAFSALPLVPPVPLVSPVSESPVRLALPLVPLVSLVPFVPLVPPVPQSPVRLALPILPAFSALSERISSIASLYFRYRKDTGSPKDYRKMSEVQTSNCRLKTRKISYSSPIHNLFQISYYSQPS